MHSNTEISHSSFNSQIVLPKKGISFFAVDDGSVPPAVRQAAQSFLDELDPDAVEFTFQTFDDQKSGDKAKGLNRNIHGSLDDVIDELYQLNEVGAAVCVTVQETDGKGRKAENIESIRSVYGDMDHGVPDDLPLEPSITVMTSDGRFQCYWKTDDMSIENFDQIMTRLVEVFGSDANAKDLARVLRIPGFKNHKRDGFKVRVSAEKKLNSGNVYTEQELLEAFLPQLIEEIAEPTDATSDFDEDELKDVLSYIPSDDYKIWIKVGAGLHHIYQCDVRGLILWDDWARKSKEYQAGCCTSKWSTFSDDHSNPASLGTIYQLAIDNGWQKAAAKIQWAELRFNGKPEGQSQRNIEIALQQLEAKLSYNSFENEHYCQIAGSQPKRLDDSELRRLWLKIEGVGLKTRKDYTYDVIHNFAEENTYHPIKDYLTSLKWDGVARLDTFLMKYCGADDTVFNRNVWKKFMVAAVRRIHKPGEQFDHLLTLEGEQGVGKSTLARILVGDKWFTDCVRLGDEPKIIAEQTRGKWIVELPELVGIGKKQTEQVKAMLTRLEDSARMAYDRKTSHFQRQFTFLGTTNADQYLIDPTGNRRFWPVKVGTIDLDSIRAEVDQLWAEAAHLEKQGEEVFLTGAADKESSEVQAARTVRDPLEERLKEIVDDKFGIIPKEELFSALGLGGNNTAKRTIRPDTLIDRVMKQNGWEAQRLRKPKGYSGTSAGPGDRCRVFVRNDPNSNHNNSWWRWDHYESKFVKS